MIWLSLVPMLGPSPPVQPNQLLPLSNDPWIIQKLKTCPRWSGEALQRTGSYTSHFSDCHLIQSSCTPCRKEDVGKAGMLVFREVKRPIPPQTSFKDGNPHLHQSKACALPPAPKKALRDSQNILLTWVDSVPVLCHGKIAISAVGLSCLNCNHLSPEEGDIDRYFRNVLDS